MTGKNIHIVDRAFLEKYGHLLREDKVSQYETALNKIEMDKEYRELRPDGVEIYWVRVETKPEKIGGGMDYKYPFTDKNKADLFKRMLEESYQDYRISVYEEQLKRPDLTRTTYTANRNVFFHCCCRSTNTSVPGHIRMDDAEPGKTYRKRCSMRCGREYKIETSEDELGNITWTVEGIFDEDTGEPITNDS